MSNALTVFRNELDKMEGQFAPALAGSHIPLERFTRSIQTSVARNPKLLEANRQSLWESAMTACALGIEPDGATGQGYFIPFKGKVQFIPGYRGLVTLAFNNGFVVEGHVVRRADEYEYEYGLHPRLVHRPPPAGSATAEARGEDNPIIAAYATARHRDHPAVFEHMDMADVLAIRNKSAGYKYAAANGKKDNPWMTDFGAMVRKTPVRQLAQHLPLQVQKAVALEAMFDRTGDHVTARRDDDGNVTIDNEPLEDEDGLPADPD